MKLVSSTPAATILALLAVAALAADPPAKVKYVAPEGFAGQKWGDLRSAFDRLPEAPIGVGAAWMRQKEKDQTFSCVPSSPPAGSQISGATGGCDFQATLLQLRRNFEGTGGAYVLSEYAIEGQGFRFGEGDAAVVLHPVVYQFCANWGASASKRAEMPPKFDELNKFCGMRFMFQSETREQVRSLPEDTETTYDRVLGLLLAKYGRPEGYLRRGRVLIETIEGDSTDAADRRFNIWRWCPAKGDGFRTNCHASVVLTLDPTTGVGTVLYSAPLLWEYAWAREHFGFKGDRLYKMLQARK